MSDAPLKTWGMGMICPICDSELVCEELVRRSEDAEIEANLLIEDMELVEKVVPMHDDEELGWIIDAMNKHHDTEFAHMAADSILLELLRESHPRTVEAFLRLNRWYA